MPLLAASPAFLPSSQQALLRRTRMLRQCTGRDLLGDLVTPCPSHCLGLTLPPTCSAGPSLQANTVGSGHCRMRHAC